MDSSQLATDQVVEPAKLYIHNINSTLVMNSDKIMYSSQHNHSDSLGQWYYYFILQFFVTIFCVFITFGKLTIMKLLIIELYLILNRMITNNSVINYGVLSNNTLIIFRILLIIFVFESIDYIQIYYKIRQWNSSLINIDTKWSLLHQTYLFDKMHNVSNTIKLYYKWINEYCLICLIRQYINYNLDLFYI